MCDPRVTFVFRDPTTKAQQGSGAFTASPQGRSGTPEPARHPVRFKVEFATEFFASRNALQLLHHDRSHVQGRPRYGTGCGEFRCV